MSQEHNLTEPSSEDITTISGFFGNALKGLVQLDLKRTQQTYPQARTGNYSFLKGLNTKVDAVDPTKPKSEIQPPESTDEL